jgi:hypothetical protein
MKHSPLLYRACRYAALAALAWAGAAPALADPTRPPAAWLEAQRTDATGGALRPALRTRIVIAGDERRLALIDGQLLRQGDRLGDVRLARIETYRLVLSNGDSLDPPTLTPLPPSRKRP